jgi:hypothetical protein
MRVILISISNLLLLGVDLDCGTYYKHLSDALEQVCTCIVHHGVCVKIPRGLLFILSIIYNDYDNHKKGAILLFFITMIAVSAE